MSDHLKKIVEEIQKLAQVPPRSKGDKVKAAPAATPATGGGAPAKSTGNVPQRGGGTAKPQGHGGSHISAVGDIKRMQQAMQNFAAAVTKYSFKKPEKPGDKPIVDDSKKPFNDFITESYMTDSPIKGDEYSTDPNRQKQQEKQPTDLIEMNNVLDGLKRIGSRGSELQADNAWDFRTNNALKNIYAFGYALVNLSKDFGRTNVQSFTDEDLTKMADLIPKEQNPSELSPDDKSAKAKELTPLINKLTQFYAYYVDAIANHPAYVRYIIGEQPLITIKPGGDPLALNEQEKQLSSNLNNVNIDFGKGPINLAALQNMNVFRQFLTDQMKYEPNQTSNPKVLQAFLQSFVQMVDGVIAKNQPKEAPQQQMDAGSPSGTRGVRQV